MCGIVGIVGKPNEVLSIGKMCDALMHRGPDAHGVFISEDKRVGLGHTRLSIIDLSQAANQPFASTDGRYVVVFNGEIYNYNELRTELIKKGFSFRTSSDTEVLLYAFASWGPSMVDKLNGMFAIAIYDRKTTEVFLFRDRMGKKPLYYYQSANCFAFASEIKAFFRNNQIKQTKQINLSALNSFLHLGYVPEPHTAFSSIFKFPNGYWGMIKPDNKLILEPYFRIADTICKPTLWDDSEVRVELASLLNQAVSRRLISDVPLGVFLSGGVDSSLITALASKQTNGPVKTFCIGFNEQEFDESGNAREVSKLLNTEHHEFILKEQDAVDQIDHYLNHFDEPFADTSAIPTMLLSKMTRNHVKVALTGDGGDELFLGYGAYTWANRLGNPFWKASSSVLKNLLRYFDKSRFSRVAHLLDFRNELNIRSHIFSQEQYFFAQHEIRDKLLVDKDFFASFEYDESYLRKFNLSPAERQALFDLKYYLKDDLLVKVDRMSMLYGLECRSPFLDRDVVQYALSIGHSLKLRGKDQKWILKQILLDYLPERLVYKKKWGFSIPLAKWLKNDLRYMLDTYLSPASLEQVGVFNPSYVDQIKTQFLNNKEKRYLYNRLWLIVVAQKWMLQNS